MSELILLVEEALRAAIRPAWPPSALRAENDRRNPLLGVPATLSGQVGSTPGCCATLATLACTATGLPSVSLGLAPRFARDGRAGRLIVAC